MTKKITPVLDKAEQSPSNTLDNDHLTADGDTSGVQNVSPISEMSAKQPDELENNWCLVSKVQLVCRKKGNQYFLNLPNALAYALKIQKGEEVEWVVSDRNTIILKRVKTERTVKQDME